MKKKKQLIKNEPKCLIDCYSYKRDIDLCYYLLTFEEININYSSNGWNIIFHICANNYNYNYKLKSLDLLKIIIDKGGHIYQYDNNNYLPIHWSIAYNNYPIIEYLLSIYDLSILNNQKEHLINNLIKNGTYLNYNNFTKLFNLLINNGILTSNMTTIYNLLKYDDDIIKFILSKINKNINAIFDFECLKYQNKNKLSFLFNNYNLRLKNRNLKIKEFKIENRKILLNQPYFFNQLNKLKRRNFNYINLI